MFEQVQFERVETLPQLVMKESYAFFLNKKEFIQLVVYPTDEMQIILFCHQKSQNEAILYIQKHPEAFFEYMRTKSIHRVKLAVLSSVPTKSMKKVEESMKKV